MFTRLAAAAVVAFSTGAAQATITLELSDVTRAFNILYEKYYPNSEIYVVVNLDLDNYYRAVVLTDEPYKSPIFGELLCRAVDIYGREGRKDLVRIETMLYAPGAEKSDPELISCN